MNFLCELPCKEVIEDRLYWAIRERFDQSLSFQFMQATNLHNMAKQRYKPLIIASRVDGAVGTFCDRMSDGDISHKIFNIKKPLQQTILYQMLKDYPMVIVALQNNYNQLPYDLSLLNVKVDY